MTSVTRRYGRASRVALVVTMVSGAAGLVTGITPTQAAATKHPPTLTAVTPTTGIAGTHCTLTGTNLLTENAVHFGKAGAASITYRSADKLVVVAPPGKGTVAVSVRTPTGTSTPESFTYDAPVVTSLSHTMGVAGTVVTVRGTGFSSTAAVLFGGAAVTGTVKNARTITFAVPAIGTARKKVDVVVHTAAGTSAPLTFIFLALKITTTSLPGAVTTQPYQGAMLQAKGGTGTPSWSVGPGFPRGLSLTAATGAISGRVGTAGTYSFSVTATDVDGASATKTLSLTVTEGPFQIETQSLPTASLDTPYSTGLLDDAVIYFPPPQPRVTDWSATGMPTGLTITSYGGTISGTPSEVGTFAVTVTVTLLGQYFATKTFTLFVQGFHITTTETAGFTSTFFAPSTTGPTALSAATASGAVHWSVSQLPGGLSLTAATGAISGAPGKAGASVGTHTFTATATDFAGATTTKQVTVQITPGPFSVTTSGVGPAYLDTYYAAGLYAYGQPEYAPPPSALTSWSATGLPAGLSITSVFGTIYGTPTATGTSRVTVTDVNVGEFFAVVAFTLSVSSFHITTSTLAGWSTELPAPATAGTTQLAATGGTGHYTWSVGAGFPQGLTLTSSGVIEPTLVTGLPGAPVTAGTYHFTVTATDGQGATSEKGFTLVVTTGTFTIGTVSTQTAHTHQPFSLALSDNFPPPTDGPTLWFASGLPSGLTITSISGAISGTPSATGTYGVTVRATFALGALWASRQFTIDVVSGLPIPTITPSPGGAGTLAALRVTGYFTSATVTFGGMLLTPNKVTPTIVLGGSNETYTVISIRVPPGKGTLTAVVHTGTGTVFPGAKFAYSTTPSIYYISETYGQARNVVTMRGSGFRATTVASAVVMTPTYPFTVTYSPEILNDYCRLPTTSLYNPSSGCAVTSVSTTTFTFTIPPGTGTDSLFITKSYYVSEGLRYVNRSKTVRFTYTTAPHVTGVVWTPGFPKTLHYAFPTWLIELRGSGFTNPSEVQFGACYVKGEVLSGNLLIFKVPHTLCLNEIRPGLHQVPVTVTTNWGSTVFSVTATTPTSDTTPLPKTPPPRVGTGWTKLSEIVAPGTRTVWI